MSTIYVVQTMIEITLALIVIWCFIHEDRLIAFENRLARRFDRWQKDLRRRFVAWGDRYFGSPELINISGNRPVVVRVAFVAIQESINKH